LPKKTDEGGKSSLGKRENNRKNQLNNGCRVAFSGGIGQALPSVGGAIKTGEGE
jgi:hypothetical protein